MPARTPRRESTKGGGAKKGTGKPASLGKVKPAPKEASESESEEGSEDEEGKPAVSRKSIGSQVEVLLTKELLESYHHLPLDAVAAQLVQPKPCTLHLPCTNQTLNPTPSLYNLNSTSFTLLGQPKP